MYKEDKLAALPYRRRILAETNAYIERMRGECDERRRKFFVRDMSTPLDYMLSSAPLREEFVKMLGRPLDGYAAQSDWQLDGNDRKPSEKYELIKVGDDEYGSIYRLWVEVDAGLYSYGLLFLPNIVEGREYPFVAALHGGLGTCEIVSSLYDSANYNDMVNRIRRRGEFIVYAPQLMLWGENYNETKSDDSNHLGFDILLKQVGGSIAALEIFKILKTVDFIAAKYPADAERMGIVGLSYGGFYTLFTAAADTRWRCALSSCFFNDRYKYAWGDWVWFDSASKFLDVEVAELVCPRALCIQVGESDELFDVKSAERLADEVRGCYERLGIGERFRFSVKPDGHQFSPDEDDIDFFVKRLTE